MKTCLIIASVLTVLSSGAFANDVAQRPTPNGAPHGDRGDMMQNLTEEQRTCIAQYGCEMPEVQGRGPEETGNGQRPEPGAKPDQGFRPEMTDEQKSNMECMQKAMENCGVSMPERPERKAQ